MKTRVSAAHLRSTVTRLNRRLRQSDQDLTPAQENLLNRLNASATPTVGQLAQQQGVSIATVSRMLAALERRSLVRRARDKRDRRVVYVIATREGTQQTAERAETIEYSWLASLTARQAGVINEALELLDQAMAEDPPEAGSRNPT